jgi:type IV secretion system protein VirD4
VIPPDSEINRNIVVYGNSGIGKGLTWVKTQIYHTMSTFEPPTKSRKEMAEARSTPQEYSLFITDPKGEHYRDTAQALMDNGYEVYAFNIIKMAASHRWNPMDYIDEDLDAAKLSNLIISNSAESHSGGDPFWPKAEKALMSAIILFVKHELPSEQVNLPNVLHIGLAYGRDEDVLNMLFDSLPYNHPAVGQYNIFRVAPADTRSGILIGFGTQISLFGYKEIAKLTSQSDFRLDDMARKKTALFLITPDSDSTYIAMTSLFMNQALQQWWKVADENGGTCPVGIQIIGDELTNIGKIPILGQRSSVMRSKGISIQIIVQAKSQLYNLYKEEADDIIQNCDTVVFLGTNDKKTAEELSADLGEMTIQVSSTSQQQSASMFTGNPNESQQYQARKLMTPDELRRATRKLNIIVQNGGYPFKTVKTPFTEHPFAKNFKKLDPKQVVPPPHRGFELFSQEDYNRICQLNLQPSSVSPQEAKENFSENMKAMETTSLLDALHKPVTALDDEGVVYTDPIAPINEAIAEVAAEIEESVFFPVEDVESVKVTEVASNDVVQMEVPVSVLTESGLDSSAIGIIDESTTVTLIENKDSKKAAEPKVKKSKSVLDRL